MNLESDLMKYTIDIVLNNTNPRDEFEVLYHLKILDYTVEGFLIVLWNSVMDVTKYNL